MASFDISGGFAKLINELFLFYCPVVGDVNNFYNNFHTRSWGRQPSFCGIVRSS